MSEIDRSRQADWFPDLVIVCQHWPDEFSEHEIHRLLARYPLARVICCYGPWCRSDGRRRDLWPFAVRVPVEEAAGRIRREREVLAGRRQPLPLTASATKSLFLTRKSCRLFVLRDDGEREPSRGLPNEAGDFPFLDVFGDDGFFNRAGGPRD